MRLSAFAIPVQAHSEAARPRLRRIAFRLSAPVKVLSRVKDYAHHGRQSTLTLASEDFLRRFVQHLLPRGFPRIRYFSFLANCRRARMLPLCRALLHQAAPAETTLLAKPGHGRDRTAMDSCSGGAHNGRTTLLHRTQEGIPA